MISIGINNYENHENFHNLVGSVNDARKILDLIKRDANKLKFNQSYESSGSSRLLRNFIKIENEYKLNKIYSYLLVDAEATSKNIRDTLKLIARNSKPNDIFVFFFAGMSSAHEGEVQLYTYGDSSLPIKDLSYLINQISAKKQLIISEAGNGKGFSNSLIYNLFEQNSILASNSDRNRIIITTKGLGQEGKLENGYGGFLSSYLLKNENLLYIFKTPLKFELDLNRQEIQHDYFNEKYCAVYFESDYRDLLALKFSESYSRGAVSNQIDVKHDANANSKRNIPIVQAVLIGTNNYKKSIGWENLQNPVNDVRTIGEILEKKYGANTLYLIDQGRNEVLLHLIKIKKQLAENDKLIVFFAGHGYYHSDYSDGFLVFQDSKGLEEDPTLDTYLPMATINRLLDGFPNKQVLTIFDVCYGGSFELNGGDLPVENYSKATFDKGIKHFIVEKNQYNSRIYLASGKYEVPDYWNNSLDHSPFAKKLIKAFEEENEFISPGKIFTYLQGNATETVLKKFGSHEPRGDFLLPVVPN
ncbi:hypothetical protein GCM10010465_10430 [Actinomadura fibrosa]